MSTFGNPDKVKLGNCKLIEEVMIGEDKVGRDKMGGWGVRGWVVGGHDSTGKVSA